MFLRPTLALLVILSACLTPRPADAARGYDNCTGFIDSLPAVITTPGTWCLRKDLSTAITEGSAITLGNSDITLDCKDFKLGGLAAGSGTLAIGVYQEFGANTTVRNCNIRGFFVGASITSFIYARGYIVEDNRFDGNTHLGIVMLGEASVIRRNLFVDTGGSTSTGFAGAVYAGLGVDILENTIINVIPTSFPGNRSYGMQVELNQSGRIEGNRISGVTTSAGGDALGILVRDSATWITGNTVVGQAGNAGAGISCPDNGGQASGNLVRGFPTAIDVCTDAGGNILP